MSDSDRNPSHGWIKPSLDDRIIDAARLGATMDEIVAELEAPLSRMRLILVRSYRYGFLTDAEALRLGIFGEEQV